MTDKGQLREPPPWLLFLSHLHPNRNVKLETVISLPYTSLSFSDSFYRLLSLCFLHVTQILLSLFTSLICSVTGATQLLKYVKEITYCMSPKCYLLFTAEIGDVRIAHLACTFSTVLFQSQVADLPSFLPSAGCFSTSLSCFRLCVKRSIVLLEREDFMCMKVHFPHSLCGRMECLLPF